MTPLQRRSTQRMGAAALLTVFATVLSARPGSSFPRLFPFLSPLTIRQDHPSIVHLSLLAFISVLPVLLAVSVAGNYLKAEPDEFIRALVVRALLWGVAITLAGDAIASVLMTSYATPFPISLLNADLLFASTIIAFRVLQRTYR